MALTDAEARKILVTRMAQFRLKMAHLKATRFRLFTRLSAEARGGDGASPKDGAPGTAPPPSHPPTPPEKP